MGIKSYIQGRHVENVWEVNCDRDEKTGKLKKKPHIRFDARFKYETLQRQTGEEFIIDGEIGKSDGCSAWFTLLPKHEINISEDEKVTVIEKIYRADLHAYMVHTDKVLSEKDIDKEEAEFKYNKLLAEYNKTMIEDDEELLSYCKVHHLKPEETDYDELAKIVPRKVKVAQDSLAIKADYMPNWTLNIPDISNSVLTTKIATVNSISANDCVIKLEG